MLRFTWKATLVVAAVTMMFAGRADAAQIVIDDFTAQSGDGVTVSAAFPASAGPTPFGGAANLATGLLASRSFQVSKTDGAVGLDASLRVAGGLLNIGNAANTKSTSQLIYTGAPTLDLSGLTGFTLFGTTNDGGGAMADLEGSILLTSLGGGTAQYDFTIPANNVPNDVTPVFITSGGGFNPALITGITLSFDATSEHAIDATIDRFEATLVPTTQVPEPTSLACLVVGIACAAGVRRFRRTPRVS